MRGENIYHTACCLISFGTSPRARGKPLNPPRTGCTVGNIPACAGKTDFLYHSGRFFWEHPRVRGENKCLKIGFGDRKGTSPRARGKRQKSPPVASSDGNIPACAGKTIWAWGQCFENQEHPRVRGENLTTATGVSAWWGTSPRARGKRFLAISKKSVSRNIPACAGKTPSVLGGRHI